MGQNPLFRNLLLGCKKIKRQREFGQPHDRPEAGQRVAILMEHQIMLA